MNTIEHLTNLVKKAKIQRSIPMLLNVHEHIISTLEYLRFFKQSHNRVETYHMNNEIRDLEDLNLMVFQYFGEIQRNAHFRQRNRKDKNKI